MCLEPEPKRQKGSIMLTSTSSTNVLGTAVEEHAPNESAITASTAPATTYNNGDGVPAGGAGAGWWESGDARRLFAPCTMLYASDCNVKEIVMKRIEVMESVNRSASNWKNVVDTKNGSTFVKAHYSESDVFSLRYRSMYLALALKQFVLNVTGKLRTQWTWKQCLCYSIEAMNDAG